MYLLSRMTEGNTEEFRKKKLSRVVFLVKLNENSDPTLRDRQSREQNSDPSFFFFPFFLFIGVFPHATRIRIVPFRHCLCVQRQRRMGFYGSTSGRDS